MHLPERPPMADPLDAAPPQNLARDQQEIQMIPSPAFSRRFLLAGAVALAALGTAPSISAQEAQRGGTLVVASVQKPRHLNAAVQSGIATAVPAAQIFATLLRYGED